jgi:hypothetical protein
VLRAALIALQSQILAVNPTLERKNSSRQVS